MRHDQRNARAESRLSDPLHTTSASVKWHDDNVKPQTEERFRDLRRQR
jgi:hypothetical protein